MTVSRDVDCRVSNTLYSRTISFDLRFTLVSFVIVSPPLVMLMVSSFVLLLSSVHMQ